MSNEAVIDWTNDEAVCKAAIPNCTLSSRQGTGSMAGLRLYRIKLDYENISDDFKEPAHAWRYVRKHHPTVIAFESQHRSAGESEQAGQINVPSGFSVGNRPLATSDPEGDLQSRIDAAGESEGKANEDDGCDCDSIGNDLCFIHRTKCPDCGSDLASKPVATSSGKRMSAKEFLASKGYAEPEGVFPISIAGLLEEFAALSAAPAPEGEKRVYWRCDWNYAHLQVWIKDCDKWPDEESAWSVYDSQRDSGYQAQVVRVDVCETIVSVRRRED